MLKLLAILVVFCGLATVEMTCQQQKPAQQHTKSTQPDIPTTPTVNNDDHSQQDQQKTPDVPRWWPEGITAVAIIFTLIAISIQTYYTRNAAEATRDAAKAALLNAEALVNAERGRLVVVHSTPDPDSSEAGIFEFKIRNIGRCPALLTFARLRVLFLTRGHELPTEPPGLEEERNFSPYQEEWVLPGDSTPLLVVDALETLDLSGKGLLARPEKIYDMRGGDLDVISDN
jgi:hypothetical protein